MTGKGPAPDQHENTHRSPCASPRRIGAVLGWLGLVAGMPLCVRLGWY